MYVIYVMKPMSWNTAFTLRIMQDYNNVLYYKVTLPWLWKWSNVNIIHKIMNRFFAINLLELKLVLLNIDKN